MIDSPTHGQRAVWLSGRSCEETVIPRSLACLLHRVEQRAERLDGCMQTDKEAEFMDQGDIELIPVEQSL